MREKYESPMSDSPEFHSSEETYWKETSYEEEPAQEEQPPYEQPQSKEEPVQQEQPEYEQPPSEEEPAQEEQPEYEQPHSEEEPVQEEQPQFGAVDIVEAFTAMRHEWRGQTKESRNLAEQIQAAVATLQELEANRLDESAETGRAVNEESKKLAALIAETDHQLTRAIRAVEQAETHRRQREAADYEALEQYFSSLSRLRRRLARPLWKFVLGQRQKQKPTGEDPALEGLNLVLARLRRSMKEHNIERVDTEGQPFDANTMNAIGTMESPDHPSGHVAEQLSPCYRWRGEILQFADVRVAQ